MRDVVKQVCYKMAEVGLAGAVVEGVGARLNQHVIEQRFNELVQVIRPA
jgi:hypothetical protein